MLLICNEQTPEGKFVPQPQVAPRDERLGLWLPAHGSHQEGWETRSHTPLFYGNTLLLAPLDSCVPQIAVDEGPGLNPSGHKKYCIQKKRVMSFRMAVVILIVQLRFSSLPLV
ncbi:hypothetical protein BDV37DRAFT_262688 [Aspergillus pseudonomiae]|uniref:Uncharacterized protein n=1 Tax=Aspergillus pseudonomiae TaxID=1506151 RepID=A0A5N7CWX1_9EURO|nr:uncharacterized protein BDV37DRAFT_262688 [Aspergillus pseudonomiae]KAE8398661.1 hypothetical protein BDV37DRAFT_262688 [Aspergillus pseudonomiae]